MTAGVINGNENFVMFTGDALQNNSGGDLVYGLQYTPATGGSAGGGNVSNSLIADLDYEIIASDKYQYGDVDIRRNLTPTAAMVSVSGRVFSSSGIGLPGISITLTGPDGATRTAITNGFGYYSFQDVLCDKTYILAPSAKNHHFEPVVARVALIFVQRHDSLIGRARVWSAGPESRKRKRRHSSKSPRSSSPSMSWR